MPEQGCPWQLPKRSTRPISGRFAGFGAGSARDGACAVRTASRGGRWLVNDGGRVCTFSSACRSPLIDPCERTSPARPSSAIASAMLSLWTSSPMNSSGFIAVGPVWFFIEATALRPAFAALHPSCCNPRLRPAEPAVFFRLWHWRSWAGLETVGPRRFFTTLSLSSGTFLSSPLLPNGSSTDFLDARFGFTQPSCLGACTIAA